MMMIYTHNCITLLYTTFPFLTHTIYDRCHIISSVLPFSINNIQGTCSITQILHLLYLTDTIKDLIDHFNNYLTTEMDSDLIVQHMLSQQLLNDQEVYTIMSAASDYQKNCLVMERIRMMDTQSLVSFCKILQKFDCQNHISSLLINGTSLTLCKLYT